MKILPHLPLSPVLGLAALASVLPTPQVSDYAVVMFSDLPMFRTTNTPIGMAGIDPSFDYHDGGAVLQVWVGKSKTNVGPVIGSQLYSIIWHILDHQCYAVDGKNTCTSGKDFLCFETDSLVDGKVQQSNTCIWQLLAVWHSEALRKLLIGAAAAMLEALTKSDVNENGNCYMLDGKKACNVGDAIRINLPTIDPFVNHIHFMITNGDTGYGNWDCCEGNRRQLVNEAMDGMKDGFSEVFWSTPFNRDTRCIVD